MFPFSYATYLLRANNEKLITLVFGTTSVWVLYHNCAFVFLLADESKARYIIHLQLVHSRLLSRLVQTIMNSKK